MLDLHCHILPGVDDGPRTLAEALAVARRCVADGITHITATPHCHRHLRLLRADILPHVARFNEDLATLPLVGILGTYIFVVFGFLSRRCERQADIFGCRTMSCSQPDCTSHTGPDELAPRGRGLCATGIGTFIDALEKVAQLNGISRHRPSRALLR